MKVYIVSIEDRCEDSSTLGPYATFELARQAVIGYVKDHYRGDSDKLWSRFDSDIAKGSFFSEDETIEIYEREVQGL